MIYPFVDITVIRRRRNDTANATHYAMPTLATADFVFGSADASALDRATRLLPCGSCGAKGPHRRIVRSDNGASALCEVCQPYVGEDSTDDNRYVLHSNPPR